MCKSYKRAKKVCAKVTSVRKKCAQKLQVCEKSVRKSYKRAKKVCAKVTSVRKKCVKSEKVCHKYAIVDVRLRSILQGCYASGRPGKVRKFCEIEIVSEKSENILNFQI